MPADLFVYKATNGAAGATTGGGAESGAIAAVRVLRAAFTWRHNRDTKRFAGRGPLAVLVRLEEEPNVRVQPRRRETKGQGTYSLLVESALKGTKTVETFGSMPAVVARAAVLVRAGYNIGIWSPVSLKKH